MATLATVETNMAATSDSVDSPQGPFERLSTEYRSVLSLLENAARVFDLPSFVEAAEAVVSRPDEERFRMSPEEIGEIHGVGDGDERHVVKRVAWLLGDIGKGKLVSKLLAVLEGPLTEMRDEALEQVLVNPEQDREATILALYLDRLLDVQEALSQRVRFSDDADELFACWHVLMCRVVLVGEGEQTRVTDDMFVDIAFAAYRLAESSGREPGAYPSRRPIDSLRAEVRREAAVLAYEELDVSVSRGAELAGTRVSEFEAVLADHGVRPGYGPDDPSELFEDTDAFDST